jgi:hypothetical protein
MTEKNTMVFMQSTGYSGQIVTKFEIFLTDFRKILKYQIP